MTQPKKKRFTTRQLTTMSILAAVASILFLVEITIVSFYKLDFSNIPVLLGTFSMGPLAGVMILAVKSALGILHTSSGGVGELADFLIGLAMILPAGLIYRRDKSRKGALIGMLVGGVAATIAGVLANIYILFPVFGLSPETVVAIGQGINPAIHTQWDFVLLITAPFNVLKWGAISALGWFLYKPLSPLLHGSRQVV